MLQFVHTSWNAVMNHNSNPLKNIPDTNTRHMIQSRKDKILELHDEIEELEGKNRELETTLESILESIKG